MRRCIGLMLVQGLVSLGWTGPLAASPPKIVKIGALG